MKKTDFKLKDVIKEIGNLPDVKRLPQPMQELIKQGLKSAIQIKFPIAIFKENNEWIATTPLIDVCAQGETQEEAIKSIIDMIDDYMSDPYTKKPKVETILQVEVKTIPINLPIDKFAQNNKIVKVC